MPVRYGENDFLLMFVETSRLDVTGMMGIWLTQNGREFITFQVRQLLV